MAERARARWLISVVIHSRLFQEVRMRRIRVRRPVPVRESRMGVGEAERVVVHQGKKRRERRMERARRRVGV